LHKIMCNEQIVKFLKNVNWGGNFLCIYLHKLNNMPNFAVANDYMYLLFLLGDYRR
jgi:hypothetical protein